MVKYSVSKNNVHIEDSYKVSKHDFRNELLAIYYLNIDQTEVFTRSTCSLELEWATHNALYSLGIMRDRTKDVDLNYPQKWYMTIGYGIVGSLVWLFIK